METVTQRRRNGRAQNCLYCARRVEAGAGYLSRAPYVEHKAPDGIHTYLTGGYWIVCCRDCQPKFEAMIARLAAERARLMQIFMA